MAAVSPQITSREADRHGGPSWRSAALVVLLLAAALALPWLEPAIPGTLSGLVRVAPPTEEQVARDPFVLPPSTETWTQPRPLPARPPRADVMLESAGPPQRLLVDRLSVSSQVVPISGESGVLLPPSDAQLLGWWREGAVPGAAHGTAVLTGHTVSTGGGAFDNLGRLVPGDRVLVRTTNGAIPYSVRSTRIYSTAALARHSRDIFALDGPGRLVLITCSGYNGRIYLSNTIVVATPVSPEVPSRWLGRG